LVLRWEGVTGEGKKLVGKLLVLFEVKEILEFGCHFGIFLYNID
jgi:hypothetical protein